MGLGHKWASKISSGRWEVVDRAFRLGMTTECFCFVVVYVVPSDLCVA